MSNDTQFQLFRQKKFYPLFCTQFLGAFNDSVFKNALIILLAFSTNKTIFNQDTLVNICAALFVIPYFLFSALAGQLADKYEKSYLIRLIKLAEVFLALLAILGFYLNSLILLLTALFLLGTQATFFGPLKYSILPQHLKETELVAGNGFIEMGTFFSILLGTILGSILIAIQQHGILWVSITIGLVATLGLIASFFIPLAKPYVTKLKIDWHPFRQTLRILKGTYQNKSVFNSILGISWFWLYGSLFLTQMPNYTKLILNGTEYVAALLLISISVGIGVGSILCAKLSHKKVDLGLVPLGAIGLTLFALDLSIARGTYPTTALSVQAFLTNIWHFRIVTDVFLLGLCGGLYLVPLYAVIQQRSLPEERSQVIAANNVLNAIFMTLASIIAIVVLNLGFSIPTLFALTALLNASMMLYICKQAPEFLTRFYARLPFKSHTNK